MADVKALFPIGKTQWAKWRVEQRIAFNETRAAGVPFADAVKYVNELELIEVNIAPPAKKHNPIEVIADVAEAATSVATAVDAVDGIVKLLKPRKPKGK